tara:strand:- start:1516 stop:1893 length:378 start_codon:yes stop_codon:yes gene_type:complete
MAQYALLKDDNSIVEEVDGDKRFRNGTPPSLLSGKGLRWLALVIVQPSFNSDTEVRTGPVNTVTETEITKTWTVRSKTAKELSDNRDLEIEGLVNDRRLKAFFSVAAEQWSMTSAELQAAIKSKM